MIFLTRSIKTGSSYRKLLVRRGRQWQIVTRNIQPEPAVPVYAGTRQLTYHGKFKRLLEVTVGFTSYYKEISWLISEHIWQLETYEKRNNGYSVDFELHWCTVYTKGLQLLCLINYSAKRNNRQIRILSNSAPIKYHTHNQSQLIRPFYIQDFIIFGYAGNSLIMFSRFFQVPYVIIFRLQFWSKVR